MGKETFPVSTVNAGSINVSDAIDFIDRQPLPPLPTLQLGRPLVFCDEISSPEDASLFYTYSVDPISEQSNSSYIARWFKSRRKRINRVSYPGRRTKSSVTSNRNARPDVSIQCVIGDKSEVPALSIQPTIDNDSNDCEAAAVEVTTATTNEEVAGLIQRELNRIGMVSVPFFSDSCRDSWSVSCLELRSKCVV